MKGYIARVTVLLIATRWHVGFKHESAPEMFGIVACCKTSAILINCGQVIPYSDIKLGQRWLRQWLGAWRHHAITLI